MSSRPAVQEAVAPSAATARSSYIRELVPVELEESPDSGVRGAAEWGAAPAAHVLVEALVAAGVDTFFGIPGGPVSPVFDAVLQTAGARLVESRHETGAAFAAAGFYRASGRVPAVIVTAGPGATNVVTGIVSAHLERVPMLVICGDVAWAASGGKLLQDSGPEGIAVEEMLAKVTRAAVRVAQARSAAAQGLAALQAATNPAHPGPALLVLPIHLGSASAERTRVVRSEVRYEATPPPEVVVEACEMIAAAERPLLVLGAGCRPYAANLRRLVDALDIPFVTTPQAKGIVSEEHPRSLRHGGLAASMWARRYTAEGVDVAIALGTDLDDCSVGPTPYVAPGGRLVHVDLDARVFNRNAPATIGVVADVGAFADAMHAVVAERGIRNGRCAKMIRALKATSAFDNEGFARDDSTLIAPHRAIADLERAAGPQARFITDIGEHMLFALHYLTAKGPDSFDIHLGLGSMGSGILRRGGPRPRRSLAPRRVRVRRRRDAHGRDGSARRGARKAPDRLRRLQRRPLQHGLPRLQVRLRPRGELGVAVDRLRRLGPRDRHARDPGEPPRRDRRRDARSPDGAGAAGDPGHPHRSRRATQGRGAQRGVAPHVDGRPGRAGVAMKAGILGLGQWLPTAVRGNDAWPADFGVLADEEERTLSEVTAGTRDDCDAIVARHAAAEANDRFLGTVRRRVADEQATACEAEANAARAALADARIDARDVDFVLSWALVPDHLMPASAPRVAHLIGAPRALGMAVDAACASTITQIMVAAALVESGRARTVVLTQSHLATRVFPLAHPASPNVGDAATAIVIGATEHAGVLATHGVSHGEHYDAVVWRRAKGNDTPWHRPGGATYMGSYDRAAARRLIQDTVRMGRDTIRELADLARLPVAEIGALASVQPRRWIPGAIAEALGLSPAIAPQTFDNLAHLGGCGVVTNLIAARERSLLADGTLVALYAQGAGFTRAAALVRWGAC